MVTLLKHLPTETRGPDPVAYVKLVSRKPELTFLITSFNGELATALAIGKRAEWHSWPLTTFAGICPRVQVALNFAAVPVSQATRFPIPARRERDE